MKKKMIEMVIEFDKKIADLNGKSLHYPIFLNYEIEIFFSKINGFNVEEVVEYFAGYNLGDEAVPNLFNEYIFNYLIALFIKENKDSVFLRNFLSQQVMEMPRTASEWKIVYWIKLLLGWANEPKFKIQEDVLSDAFAAVSGFLKTKEHTLPLHKNKTLLDKLCLISAAVLFNNFVVVTMLLRTI